METSQAPIESADEEEDEDDDEEEEEEEDEDEDEEEIVNMTRCSRDAKSKTRDRANTSKVTVRSSGKLIESKEQSNLHGISEERANDEEMRKNSGKKSSTASISSVKLGIGKKLRFNLRRRSSQGQGEKNNFLTPNSAKAKQQTSIESSTSETAVSSALASSNTQAKSGSGSGSASASASVVDTNATSNQVMARRGKREKASAKRERKATKTLAIVLGE